MTAIKFACQKLIEDMTAAELIAELEWDLKLLKRLEKDHTDGTKVTDRAINKLDELKARLNNEGTEK
jgi:hypothetical protein